MEMGRESQVRVEPLLKRSLSLWEADRAKAVRTFLCYLAAMGGVGPLEKTFTLFLPSLIVSLKQTPALTNVAFSILIFVYAVVGPFFAKLGSRYGMHTCILAALIANTMASFAIPLTTSLMQLYLFYFIGGFGIGAVYAPGSIAAMQVMPSDKQAIASGLATVSYSLLPSLIAMPVRHLILTAGWRTAFSTQGIITTIALIGSYLAFPRTRDADTKQTVSPKRTDPNASDEQMPAVSSGSLSQINRLNFALYYAVMTSVSVIYYFVEAENQVIFEAELPKESIAISIGSTVNLVTNVVFRVSWGGVASIFPARLVMAGAVGFAGLCLILWSAATTSTAWSLVASSGVTAGIASMWTLLPVIAAQIFGDESASVVYSMASTGSIFSVFLGAPAVSELAELLGWPATMQILSAVAGVGVLMLLLLRQSR